MLDKYNHICVICRQAGSLATDNVPSLLNTCSLGTLVDGIANRQRACLPKFGKLCSLAFHHSSGHLITYSCVAYLNTLPAGLCFKPLEYILITIFKEKNKTTYIVYVIRRAKLDKIQGGLQRAIQDSTKGGLQKIFTFYALKIEFFYAKRLKKAYF